MDSLLTQVEKSDKKIPDAPVMGVKEHCLPGLAESTAGADKGCCRDLRRTVKQDSDGSASAKLAADPSFKAAALEALHGDTGCLDVRLNPCSSRAALERRTERTQYAHGKQRRGRSGHPVFDPRGFFKEGVMDASPRALKFLGSPEGNAERDKLLSSLNAIPGCKRWLMNNQQGEVRDEDRLRAL